MIIEETNHKYRSNCRSLIITLIETYNIKINICDMSINMRLRKRDRLTNEILSHDAFEKLLVEASNWMSVLLSKST